jgi:hypothetical protein
MAKGIWGPAAEHGDALLIPESFPNVEALKREFDILKFLDLCSGLEAAVLHSKLFTYWLYVPDHVNPAVDALLDAGVIELFGQEIRPIGFRTPANPTPVPPPYGRQQLLDRLMCYSASSYMDEWDERKFLNLPTTIPATIVPAYLYEVRIEKAAEQQMELELLKTYNDFKEGLDKIRRSVDRPDAIRFPPVAIEVLSMCNTLDQLGSSIMDVRKRYTNVRTRFRELSEVMASADIPMKKKLCERNRMLNSINSLFSSSERASMTLMTSFAKDMNDITKIDGLSDGLEWSDMKWGGLVKYAVKNAESFYWKFQLRPLHGTKEAYFNLSLGEIYKIIERLFGHQLTPGDEATVKMYRSYVAEILLKIANK